LDDVVDGGGVSKTGLSVWAGDEVSEAFDTYRIATSAAAVSMHCTSPNSMIAASL